MSTSIRVLNQRLGVPGRMALLLLIVAIVVLLLSFRSLGRAFLAPSAKEVKNLQDEKIKQLAGEYSKSLAAQTAQFTGRSVFFIPSAPIPPPPPPPTPTKQDDTPPPPPPPPATYGGPKLIGMINGVAWFDDGQRLEAGQDGKDGLKLKEIKAPWDIAVVWKEKDFDVSLFDRDKVINPPPKPIGKEPEAAKESGGTTEASKESPEAPKPDRPDAPKPDAPKPDATKPDAPKPDSPKPESPKPESPTPAPTTDPKPDAPANPAPQEPTVEPAPSSTPPAPKPDQPV